MSIYSETDVYPSWVDEIDLTDCENCDFGICGVIDYCLKECGENYIVSNLIISKGYRQCNIDFVFINGEFVPGVEIYKRESETFIQNMIQLGHTCEVYQHPFGKKYLATIIIDGGVNPIELCLDFHEMDVIK